MEKKQTLFIHVKDDGAIDAADCQFLLRSIAMEDPNIQRPADITKELEAALEHFYPLAKLVHETCARNAPNDALMVSHEDRIESRTHDLIDEWLRGQLREAEMAFFKKAKAS